MKSWASIALVAAALSLGGCGAMRGMQEDFRSVVSGGRGEPALATGIRQYEEGNYAAAAENLNRALFEGLSSDGRVKAHKYLAFTHCVSNRPSACLVEFRRALAINPNLELSAAEAGHPIWGPVFRAVKSTH